MSFKAILEKHRMIFWLVRDVVRGLQKKNISWLSAALVFYILLSLGPFMLIIMEVMELFLSSDVVTSQLNTISETVMSGRSVEVLHRFVANFHILEANILVIVLSLIALFFLASQAILHIKRSVDTIYQSVKPMRLNLWKFLERNLYGFMIVLLTGMVLSFLVFLKFFLQSLQSRLAERFPSLMVPSLVNVLITVFSILFVLGFFIAAYRFLSERNLEFSSVVFGGSVATIFFLIGGVLIGWYVSVAPLMTTYGFTGSLLFLLLWLYYSAHVLLVGAQVAYSHHKLLSYK